MPRSLTQSDRILFSAIAVSLAVHAILLAVHFVSPDAIRFKSSEHTLDVILVNKSGMRPVKATALAQSDLNGGGEQEKGRAKSFLVASNHASDGESLKDPQTSVSHLEQQQVRLLSQLRQSPNAVAPDSQPAPQSQPDADSLTDPATLKQKISRMEAQIDKEIDDYNSRPRRGFVGPNTRRAADAMYYTELASKIERIGTLNFPAEARGRYYGSLILSVTLSPDGSIYNDEVVVTQSSGYPVLDRAAKRIVRMAAPYGRFPAEMRRDYDIYEFVAKFAFLRGDTFEADVGK